ncbi:GGDEF domain-containing protein [Mycolicibacterium llatzerense]|uniref:GGDEF domain-containing protein n=1 Tax=Mycolicibacterium llatzerense TaxID=280871 RepID=UPI0013A6CB68|nr:GGDEF domain-containing protein [Mycolicibacterium llatzerense]
MPTATANREGPAMHWLRRWWHQPDHFNWIMAYIKTRGLAGLVRTMVAIVTCVSGLLPLVLMTLDGGPTGDRSRLVVIAASGCLFLLGLLWAFRMPTMRCSRIFAAGTTACIAAVALSCSDPFIAMFLCTAFTLPATYIAFAHTAPYAVYNFQIAMIVAVIEAVRIGQSGRPVLGMCAVWLVVVLTTTAPASIQIIVHSLGIDLLQADSDPLTLALNRRAFSMKAQELVYKHRDTDSHLVLMVIDLDGFKLLNDERGHAVGDRALLAVADILRAQTRDTAVIGRVGGDEFLIADVTNRPRQISIAERLRAAIARMSFPVTASIGIATVELSPIDDSGVEATIDDLVIAADRRMYVAKRAGGNRIQHADATFATIETARQE